MRRTVILTLMSFLFYAPAALASTTLLSPNGASVGGIWQHWMNHSLMPTYNGPMVLDFDPSAACGDESYQALGCTSTTIGFLTGVMPLTDINLTNLMFSSAYEGAPHTWIARWALLYEQGHVIDNSYLTDPERAAFAAYWHRPVPAGVPVDTYWWQGEANLGNDQPVMGEWFASDYELCAVYRRWTLKLVGRVQVKWPTLYDYYPLLQDRTTRRLLHRQERSCALIRGWVTS